MEGMMFLSDLTEPQKIAFCDIAMGLIYSDEDQDKCLCVDDIHVSNSNFPNNGSTSSGTQNHGL
jgi:hypothetical protein